MGTFSDQLWALSLIAINPTVDTFGDRLHRELSLIAYKKVEELPQGALEAASLL